MTASFDATDVDPHEADGSDSWSSRPVLVGRTAERATLDAAMAAARGGHRTAVLVYGSPGFGKTALVNDLLDRTRPARLWRATAETDETSIPYGVLGELLRGAGGELPPHLSKIAEGTDVDADPLAIGLDLLSVLDKFGGASEGGKSGKSGVADAGDEPLTLVVDDIQWADPLSLRSLVFALRRLVEVPVLTVLICRRAALSSLPASLRRLVADIAVRIEMRPLDPADVRTLADALGQPRLAARTARRIVEHSGGSPLYARAILGELAALDGPLPPDRPLPVPDSYAQLIETRLEKCPAAATELINAAAVMAVPQPIALVAAVAGLVEPLVALDDAVASELLQRPGPDLTLRLVHPLAQAAVYQAMAVTHRSALHNRAAELLAPTDDAASLRHRIAAADGTDEGLATAVARRASTDVSRQAWDSAATWLRAAVQLSRPPEADDYLLRLVEAVVAGADVAAEPSLRVEVASRPPSALREYLLARLRTLVGDLADADRHAHRAWDLVDISHGTDTGLIARVAAELARTSLTTGHAAAAIDWAGRALAADPAGSFATVDMPGTMLLATALQGNFDQALAAVTGLPPVIAEPTARQIDAMIARGILSLWSGDLDQASVDLAAVVRVTRHDGPMHLNLGATAYLADAAYRLGDWDIAISEAETGIALALDLDHVRSLPMLHAAAATPYAYRGDFARAASHVEAASRTARIVGDMQTLLWSQVAAGRLAHARRDPIAVVAALEPLAARATLDGVREPGFQPWQCLHSAALADLGRDGEAGLVLDDAAQLAELRGQVVERLAVQRTRAEVIAKQGRLDEALTLLLAARSHYDAVRGHPFEVARFDLTLGRLSRQAGDRRQATGALRRARKVFGRLHATPWEREAVAELDQCGAHGRGRPSIKPPH